MEKQIAAIKAGNRIARAGTGSTIDPTQISGPSDIPPQGAQYVGTSPKGQVDVYCGTLDGDIDAKPCAQELLASAPDTGGASNADYIYNQVSKLYGGIQLPNFQSPSGKSVNSLVFASGSNQGPFGAFHFPGTQTDFDRIVTDSLNGYGNSFPAMRGSQQGGLFAHPANNTGTLPQDAQTDASSGGDAFGYGPPLPASVAAKLAQQAAPFRVPQDDQKLQKNFWPHVYNELPGTGTNTYRLQVITGPDDNTPQAVQITGTVQKTKLEPDGDMHVWFQPDSSQNFPTNQSSQEAPLEVEIIYAGPVTQADAQQAEQGYTNPFDTSQLQPGARIQVAGPLIYDRAHGKVDANGNVQVGLEIHPVCNLALLTGNG